MKEVFILKKVGDIEYLVINKKDVEMFCNIQRGVYETKYFRENCLTEEEIREYFIKEKGVKFTSDELHKPSTYEYNCSDSEKIIGDLYIVKFDKSLDSIDSRVTQDFFRNFRYEKRKRNSIWQIINIREMVFKTVSL